MERPTSNVWLMAGLASVSVFTMSLNAEAALSDPFKETLLVPMDSPPQEETQLEDPTLETVPKASPYQPGKTFQVKATKKGYASAVVRPREVILDEQSRTIGGAVDKSGLSVGKQLPAQKFHFEMPAKLAYAQPRLSIGRISGINTPEAHAAGQSAAPYVSSPVVVKVNGKKVHYIYENASALEIRIPKWALRQDGYNTVQIDAGYYFPTENRVAYDEVSFQNVSMKF